MSTMTPQAKSWLYWLKSAICLLLIFCFGYIEPFGSLPPVGMHVLGIFIGMLFGWTFIGFIWPSIMGLLALGLCGYQSVSQVITAGMGNTTVTVLVLFLFVFATYLDNIGLSRAIANWFISRKIAVGKPWVFTTLIFICAYVLGATVSLFASIVLMWNIFYHICETAGYQKKQKYPMLVLIGIVYSAMLGFALFPFKATQLVVQGALSAASGGLTLDFASFTILTFCITVVGLTAYILICKFILRPDVEPLKQGGDMFSDLRGQKLDQDQKIGAAFLVFFFFAMFAPSIFPKTTAIGTFFGKLGTTGSLIFVMGVLAILQVKGKKVLDFKKSAAGINWDMVIMFMATMPVSQAMSSDSTGVMAFIVELVEPLFVGMSPTMFSVVFIVAAGLITQVAHNLVLAAIFPPILYNFSIALGADPLLLTTIFAFSIAVAIATPGGSAPGALIYLNTEWIDIKSAYKYCFIITIINLIVMVTVGLTVGKLIF